MNSFEDNILRVLKGDTIVGTAFLVSERLVATCAHVVESADVKVGGNISLRLSDGKDIVAVVAPEFWRDPNAEDVSILRLEYPLKNIRPVILGSSSGTKGHTFSTFGFPKHNQELSGRGEIIGQAIIDGIKVLQLRSPEVTSGFSGALIFDEITKRAVGMVVAITPPDEYQRLGTTAFAVPTETIREICSQLKVSDICPYLGLDAFTAETAHFFFGREVFTEKLLNIIRTGCRFLAVFGPSGSGKSSVVMAGLLPALKKNQLPGSQKWVQVTIRPANDPFAQLKAAELDLANIDRYMASKNGNEHIILFVDQFEELFTQCADDIRKKFISELTAALENPRLVLIISMRDDFYNMFQAKAVSLAESEHLKIANVPGTLKRDELLAMIQQPAMGVGLKLEDGLTELILKDIDAKGDASSSTLPLLEFALTQLWERRRDGFMTREAYQAIGGVTGSLAFWAENAYSVLSRTDQFFAETLFIGLVSLGDETGGFPDARRRRALADFSPSLRKVIRHFADRRLLITSRDNVELVHDALVQEWSSLRRWLDDNRRLLIWQQKINEKQREWKAGTGELLQGRELIEAQGFLRDHKLAIEKRLEIYIRESERRQVRRRNYLTTITSAVLLVFAFLAVWGQRNANEARTQAKITLARQLAAQAQSLYATGDWRQMTAVLLAVKSMQILPSVDALAILQEQSLARLVSGVAHSDAVYSLDFSPDGKYVVSGSKDHTLAVWEAATGTKISVMIHGDAVSAVAFSPDGKYVVSSSNDKTARVWEAATGKEISRMLHEDVVNCAAFSPDGKYVVSASDDKTARVWEAATGKEISRMLHEDVVNCAAFSPDGKYVVSASDDKTVRVWEATTGKEVASITESDSRAFSPDGKYIALVTQNGTQNSAVRVLEVFTGKEIFSMFQGGDVSGMSSIVSSVRFSPDGKYVIWGSYDRSAQVWEVATGKKISEMIHNGAVLNAVFSPDGKYVASGGFDGTVRVWEAATGKEVSILLIGTSNFAFSPDSRYIVTGSEDGTALVWEATPKKEFIRMTHNDSVNLVDFSPDEKYILSGGNDGTARVWEADTGKEVARMSHDYPVVLSVAFSADGKYAVSADGGGTIKVWEAKTGNLVSHMTRGDEILFVAFSPDGKSVISGEFSGDVIIWDLTSGREIAHMGNLDEIMFRLALSRDGKYAATGSSAGAGTNVIVWELATGKKVSCKSDMFTPVYAIAFSPDDKYVVFGGNLHTVHVCETDTGHEVFSVDHDDDVNSLTFSPDGKYILSGSIDKTARIWDATTGKEVARMTHGGSVLSVAFSLDGKYVVSGSSDNTVRVWDAITGKEVSRMTHDRPVVSVAFSRDGKYVLSGSRDTTIRLWKWQPYDWIADACSRLPRNLTREEWNQYIGDVLPYQAVCPNLPIEPEATITPIPTP
jgi:WD40 repeat protein